MSPHGRPGHHRPAREDRRGQGPRPEEAGRPVQRRPGPRPAAAHGPRRLLQLRRDLSPQPGGTGVPGILKQAKLGDNEEKLNRLLQELAWEAVTQHPLSGVQAEGK